MTTVDPEEETLRSPRPADPIPSRAPADAGDGFRVAVGDADEDGDDPGDHGRVGYGGMAKYTPLALALLMIAGLMALGIERYGRGDEAPDPASRAGNLLGAAAPDVTLNLLDGETLRLADLRGRVVVLNFWATWSEPCKEEMPLFQDLSEAGSADGVPFTIVGMGVRARDTPEAITEFTRSLGITYPIAYDSGGDSPLIGPVELAFGRADVLPLTFVIAPDGTVANVQVGAYREPDELVSHITEAAERDRGG